MNENTMILALHDLFEKWQDYKPYKEKFDIWEELEDMLSIVAEEQGVFETDDNPTKLLTGAKDE